MEALAAENLDEDSETACIDEDINDDCIEGLRPGEAVIPKDMNWWQFGILNSELWWNIICQYHTRKI